MTETTQVVQNVPPEYIQDLEMALFERIYGSPDDTGVLSGGILDPQAYPDIFQIPDYVQAGIDPTTSAAARLQGAVTGTLDTPAGRQAFFDRYQPYFQDAEGNVRFLPEASSQLSTGATTIANLLGPQGEFATAQDFLREGRGGVDVGGIFADATRGVGDKIERGTGTFDARRRADALLGGAQTAIEGGLGQFTTDPSAYDEAMQSIASGQGTFGVDQGDLRRGTGTFNVDEGAFAEGQEMMRGAQGEFGLSGGLADARASVEGAAGGRFATDPAAYNQALKRIAEGQGQFGVDEAALRRGTGEYTQSGGLADARASVEGAAGGQFGAREAFERGTGRAFELAEQGLGAFDPSSAAQAFMDPYKEQVIDAAMQRIDREGAKRRQADAAKAIGAGAFGGSRAGVQAAETARAIEETKQQTVANLMSQGYDKAMANAMATDEAARKRALQASGLTGQLGAQGAGLESSAFEDAAKRGLAAATTSAGLSQTEEQLRQQAFSDAQKRTMASEQQINAAKQKAFDDARARGLTGAQLETVVAKAGEDARQQAFEDEAKRGLSAATTSAGLSQAEEQIRQKAFEDAKARGLTGAQLSNAVAETLNKLGMSAFESGAQRTMSAEQQINAAKQKAFEDAKARGLTGAQLQTAVTKAEQDARMQAFEDSQRRQLSGGQELGRLGLGQLSAESGAFEAGEDRMIKAADMYRSMGLSEAEATAKAKEDEYNRSLEAGRLTGGIGQTMGQLGGAQADIGQAYGQLAGTSADIGRVYAGMQPADLGFMYELGGKEREYEQQGLDFQRQNVLNQTQQTLAPYSYAQTFLTRAPSASMYGQFTQTPQAQTNPFLSGVGAYTTMQSLNQQ